MPCKLVQKARGGIFFTGSKHNYSQLRSFSNLSLDYYKDDEVGLVTHRLVSAILLNRPKAYNALNLNMIRLIKKNLMSCENNPDCHYMFLRGVHGPKFFCAGGDVKAIYYAGLEKKRREKEKKEKLNKRKELEQEIGELGAQVLRLKTEKKEVPEEIYQKRKQILEELVELPTAPTAPTDDESVRLDRSLTRIFFKEEYQLDYYIATTRKPLLVVMDGITMGGGVGISAHATYCMATESTVFSMPETSIGFFPDVGVSYILSRLFRGLGMFLALTGYRLKGPDVYHAGIVRYYASRHKAMSLEAHAAGFRGGGTLFLNMMRDATEEPDTKFSLEPHLEMIEKCFYLPSTIEGVVIALEREQLKTQFAADVLQRIRNASPTSLKVTFKQITEAKQKTLEECFMTDYRLSQRFMEGDDFYTGVDSALISKQPPKWNPKTLDDVKDEDVAKYFAPLPNGDELLLEKGNKRVADEWKLMTAKETHYPKAPWRNEGR